MSDFFPANPWGHQGSDTPRPSRAPTPAASSPGGSIYTEGTNPHPPSLATYESPTESLAPAHRPKEWIYQGVPYDSLNAAAAAAAENDGIAPVVRDWVLECFKLYAQRDSADVYNVLAAKVTEHRILARHEIQAVDNRIREVDERLVHLEREALRRSAQIGELQNDNQVLHKENAVLHRENKVLTDNNLVFGQAIKQLADDNKDLRNQLDAIKAAGIPPPTFTAPVQQPTFAAPQPQPQFAAPPPAVPPIPPFPPAFVPPQQPVPPVSQNRMPKLPDPPKFSGKGSKLTLDQWTQQFGIWLRYQQFTDDNAKIMAALMFLEGGPLSYMSERVKILARGMTSSNVLEPVIAITPPRRQQEPS